MHRIALISDLHGNAIALREVLRSIQKQGADEIVCLGDVATLGVAPVQTIQTLRDLGCRCIMGNHDDYLLGEQEVDAHTEAPIIQESIAWCRDLLSEGDIDFLRNFERSIEITVGDVRIHLFHGSPTSNTVDLLAETPADEFDVRLGPSRASVMAGGHTHLQMARQHRGTLVINPGSVGAPFAEVPKAGPPKILGHAEYATLELDAGGVSVCLHRVRLDQAELHRAALLSTIPMRAEIAAAYC